MTDENKPQPNSEANLLKTEIIGLFNQIQKIKHEIAAIKMPGVSPNHFGQMSDELDAIVTATEAATNTIMENVENIDDIVASVRETTEDENVKKELNQIPDLIGNIFESCSFQDITGQRVDKIISLLKHVETRVNSLVEFWGESAIDDEDIEKDGYEGYLHGPAARGEGIAQDSVDSFFEGNTDADALKEIEKETSGESISKQELLARGKKDEGIKNKAEAPAQSSTVSAAPEAVEKKNNESSAIPAPLQQDAIDALFD